MTTRTFHLSEYVPLSEKNPQAAMEKRLAPQDEKRDETFDEICAEVKKEIERDWNDHMEEIEKTTALLRDAIIGKRDAVDALKRLIENQLRKKKKFQVPFPPYYKDLVDGIFQECFGYAGLAEFFTEKYKNTSSAKIIGERIYFMIGGRLKLMPQRINKERRQQLVNALLMANPEERKDKDSHEVQLISGERITIFNDSITTENMDTIVVRRYTLESYTFDEQVRRGTMSAKMAEMFTHMVPIGYTVIFCGAVRTAKSSLMATWQTYEDPTLEGVLVETNPEIDIEHSAPTSPIMHIIADGEKLSNIIKKLMRSDADYLVIGEARDGLSLETSIALSAKGARHGKLTYHTRFPDQIVMDIAIEVDKYYHTGDLQSTRIRVAKAFDYVLYMVQLADKSKKRLHSMYEVTYDKENECEKMTKLIEYQYDTDSWKFHYHISKDKEQAGRDENATEFETFQRLLRELSEEFPMEERKEETHVTNGKSNNAS